MAVTQHDHYYTGKQDEELDATTTRDHVYEGLQQVGYTVPPEQIVIVSGQSLLSGSCTYILRVIVETFCNLDTNGDGDVFK